MAVVDIHTHMFGPAWMALFKAHRAPGMDLIPWGEGRTRLVVDGVPDLVMLPAIHDYGLRIKVMDAHGGGYLPFIATRLDMFRRCSGARPDAPDIDVMAQLSRFYLDAVVYQPEALDLCIKLVGADKMLLGTDYPMPADFDRLHALTLGLPADRSRAVRGGNAARIFGL